MLKLPETDQQLSLTARETQVLELVAMGFSAKEIALSMTIAPRTVERHIENVRLKMRARNRTHMVTQAVLSGVLLLGVASATSPGPAKREFHDQPKGSQLSLLDY